MNLILSTRTLFHLLLVLSCSPKIVLNRRMNKVNEQTTTMANQMTEYVPTPATTPDTLTISQSNHAEIAVVLVLRKSLKFSSSDICAGILVSARTVITAAHCFYDPHGLYRRYPHMFRVAYEVSGGYHNIAVDGPLAELVVAHPNYNEYQRINDIGAIRLKASMEEESPVIANPSLPLAQRWNNESQLEILLFSIENENIDNIITHRIAASFPSKYKCEESYRKWGVHINPKQLCIELVEPELYYYCESAILLLNGQPIGVLSFQFDVTSTRNSLPYIYTELSQYSEFIQKEIYANSSLSLGYLKICSSILYLVISWVAK